MTATASEGLFVVTDDTTRADIEEALHHLTAAAKRLPSHYVDRRADIHRRMNVLLCEWQMRP
jgi:ribosomal protein S15P/S13E